MLKRSSFSYDALLAWGSFLMLPVTLFASMSTVIWLFVITLGALGTYWAKTRSLPSFSRFEWLFLSSFTLWVLISSFWSIHPLKSLGIYGRVFSVFFIGFILKELMGSLSELQTQKCQRYLLWGFGTSLVLLLLEMLFERPLGLLMTGKEVTLGFYNKFACILALIAWVPIQLLGHRANGFFSFLIYGLLLGFFTFLWSESTTLAFFLAGFCWIFVYFFREKMLYTLSVLTFVSTLASPFLTLTILKPSLLEDHVYLVPSGGSLLHRLHVWEFTTQKIFEKPLTGWGFGSSADQSFRILSSWPAYVKSLKPGELEYIQWQGLLMPNHPHNIFLQGWFELGFPGALLMAFFLSALPLFIGRYFPERSSRASVASAFITGLLMANSTYGIWQNWWLATFFIGAAFLISLQKSPFLSLKPQKG